MASIRTINIGDTLTIKKIAQCCSPILTNHSSHPDCPYTKTNNVDHILEVGTQLTVLDKGPHQTKWAQSYVTVKHKDKSFDILAKDLRRYCE
tara:strand:+ start:515 stop:790 length:276 start_codon:yes stop_codon:yes gene_type:complete